MPNSRNIHKTFVNELGFISVWLSSVLLRLKTCSRYRTGVFVCETLKN